MIEETNKPEVAAGQEATPLDKNSRRDFLKQGAVGLAGLAGTTALGFPPSSNSAQPKRGSA
jgi:hypothetical protein